MGSGNPNGNKPMLCPHGVLGKTKCGKCKSKYQLDWQARNPEWLKKYNKSEAKRASGCAHMRRLYGLPSDFGGKKRKGKCPICRKKNATLVPDHNHVTKKFRAWVCGPCNRALGFFERKNAKRFIQYLERHK